MTLWIIGFLFSLGYLGYFESKMRWWKSLTALFFLLGMWPVFLGMELYDVRKETKKENNQ